jgi:cytochrome b involved in lipid metabolism
MAVKYLQNMFNNNTFCGAMDSNNHRAETLAQYNSVCSSLPEDMPATNPTNCLYAVKAEAAQCGFPLMQDGKAYCSPNGLGTMSKDPCCLMAATPHGNGTTMAQNSTGAMFTLAEITEKKLTVLHGMVYDLKEYAQEHKGGASKINSMMGSDGTEFLETAPHKGEKEILEKVHKYMLGSLAAGTVVPATAPKAASTIFKVEIIVPILLFIAAIAAIIHMCGIMKPAPASSSHDDENPIKDSDRYSYFGPPKSFGDEGYGFDRKPSRYTSNVVDRKSTEENDLNSSGITLNPTADFSQGGQFSAFDDISIDTKKILFEYIAERDDELTLNVGEYVEIYSIFDDGWAVGMIGDRRGVFPLSCTEAQPDEEVNRKESVKKRQSSLHQSALYRASTFNSQYTTNPTPNIPEPPVAALARKPTRFSAYQTKVLFSYRAERDDELTLKPGDIVDIQAIFDDGWAVGKVGDRRGAFPLACTQPAKDRYTLNGLRISFGGINGASNPRRSSLYQH